MMAENIIRQYPYKKYAANAKLKSGSENNHSIITNDNRNIE